MRAAAVGHWGYRRAYRLLPPSVTRNIIDSTQPDGMIMGDCYGARRTITGALINYQVAFCQRIQQRDRQYDRFQQSVSHNK